MEISKQPILKLKSYDQAVIPRGSVFRCLGDYPYEAVIDFMVCESIESRTSMLVVASGYKAGIVRTILPIESVAEGFAMALDAKWMIAKWNRWGYVECPLEDVYLIEPFVPTHPRLNDYTIS